MKPMLFIVALACGMFASVAARADDTCDPGVRCLKMVTIYGRAPRPMVVVELRHASAATAAGQAHAEMRERWLKQLVPVTLRR